MAEVQVIVNGRDIRDGADGLTLQDLREAVGVIQAAQWTFGEVAIEATLLAAFAAHPKLESVSWRQYTPYFNDGDTCTFSANLDCPELEWDGEEIEDLWLGGNGTLYGADDHPDSVELAAVMADLALLAEVDDAVYLAAYGDHVRVTARMDEGRLVVTTSECGHD